MKQIDYLKLVATGRKSIHYARPSDADHALTGLIGYAFVISLLFVFAIAILASYLGATVQKDDVGLPIAATFLMGIAFFALTFFIGGAPRLVRACLIAIAVIAAAVMLYLTIVDGIGRWYLFAPPFLYVTLVCIGSSRQLAGVGYE